MNQPAGRYHPGSIALHWLHALVVLGLIGWGIWMADLPKGPERGWAIGIHKSFGLIAAFLIVCRIGWRIRHKPPRNPALKGVDERLAKAGHATLYVLLVLVPVAGFTSVSFTEYPLKFFGIELPKPGYPDEALNDLFSTTHRWLAWSLLILIVLHVAAALRHALRHDGTLQRMLPGGKPSR